MISNLSREVTRLVEHSLKAITTAKREGWWRVNEMATIRYKIDNFRYDPIVGNAQYGTSLEVSNMRSLDQGTKERLFDIIKLDTAFGEVREQIDRIKGFRGKQGEVWLITFLTRIANESTDSELSLVDVSHIIQAFLNDVSDGPVDWTITSYLSGLVVKDGSINLDDKTILRQVTQDDLEKEINRHPGTPYGRSFLDNATAVLEIHTLEGIHPMIYPAINVYLLLFLLFGNGSVNHIRTQWKGESILRYPGEFGGGPMFVGFPNEKYVLRKEDLGQFKRFADVLKDKLPIDSNGQVESDHHIGISIARYQDAILRNEVFVNRISYAVMGMEALYLKPNEVGELNLRLSQRVAKLIAEVEQDNIFEIYKTMNRAYEIRSRFVHGSVQDGNTSDHKQVMEKLLKYLRKSIILFIMLSPDKKKEIILNTLDNAVLDHKITKKFNASARLFREIFL